MGEMKRYHITMSGTTPLIMHRDNPAFAEIVSRWCQDPANKEYVKKGDDRSPGWAWIGYLYHDGTNITMNADNLATCIREGGAKVPTGNSRGDQSYKRLSQSGIVLDAPEYTLLVNGEVIPLEPIKNMMESGEIDFNKYMALAESLGFELFVKRAKIGMTKHLRVRPLFRNWKIDGTITVLDEEMFKLTPDIIQKIFAQAGMFVGIGDWRPGAQKSPGFYGKFTTEFERI